MGWRIVSAVMSALILGLSGCGMMEDGQDKVDSSSANQEKQSDLESEEMDNYSNNKNKADEKKPNKPSVEKMTHTFRNLLIQETDKEDRVKKYDSKSELVQALTEVTTKDLAQVYVEEYYDEKDGKLYLEPKDAPAWINTKQPYQTKRVDSHTYRVIQEVKSELYGHYRLTVTFKFQENHWVIQSRNMKRLDLDRQEDSQHR
ncbi:hypothetical protein [Lentibacillus cibarius]|uniref:Lipoprotein n=1 Tax=Lentibacillus cibarius TaxID=2583219 RepID=A0A5S3QJB2_9BACI|nr:hypothetical protein [Lentibacillus cibarius]TMN21817.1 hypothetical protein FFL34_06605 [Lentibacillus cibarius]